jgi:hypothetical protein
LEIARSKTLLILPLLNINSRLPQACRESHFVWALADLAFSLAGFITRLLTGTDLLAKIQEGLGNLIQDFVQRTLSITF